MKTRRGLTPLGDFFDPMTNYENFFRGFNFPEVKKFKTDYDFNPACEVKENDKNYLFRFEIPGVSKDSIKVEVHDNQLVVSGEKKEQKQNDDEKNHFSETFYGSFMRSFTLPGPVDPEKVHAELNDGVLKLEVPKDSPQLPKREVQIK